MFDKTVLLQHIINEGQYTSADGLKTMTAREKYNEYQQKDAMKAQDAKKREEMEIEALKKTTRSNSYGNASEEERSKMLETGISSIGNDPSTSSSNAEFRVRQNQRAKNIDTQTQNDFNSMTPDQKMLSPDEMRKRGLIASKYGQTKSVSTGRPLNPNNPYGPKISTPDDKDTKYQYRPDKPIQYPNNSRGQLFAAQDDLSNLKQGIRDRRAERASRDSSINSQANRDIYSAQKFPGTAGDLNRHQRPLRANEKSRLMLQDQGVDVNNPMALARESGRRQNMLSTFQRQTAIARANRNRMYPQY